MSRPVAPPPRSVALDILRGGAALLVLLSHARAMLMRDAASQPGLGGPGLLFFAVSGLGHQAVVVFFVLSGDLVTRSMLRLRASGRWSLFSFAAGRLVRLWVVLVPCLLGGLLLDRLGLALVPGAAPYGVPPIAGALARPVDLDAATLVGNLLFLQTVAVPVLGSNGALWSLANEAWYYALAGLVFAAWAGGGHPLRRAALCGGAVAVAALLPPAILALAPIWAFGAVAALLRDAAAAVPRRPLAAIAALSAVGLAGMARLHAGIDPLGADLGLGAAVAVLVWAVPVPSAPGSGGVVARFASGLARRSYGLYLSHCPVLAILAAILLRGSRLEATAGAAVLLVGCMGVAGCVAEALWWGFERHTDRLRMGVVAAAGCRPALVFARDANP